MKQTINHTSEHMRVAPLAMAREAILRTLAYFDLFNYPLSKEEICQFADREISPREIDAALAALLDDGLVFYLDGWYSLQDNMLLAHRRRCGNQRAETLLMKAQKIGRFLHRFPYVRAVGISGSLSKNFADEKADIDFFIITKANRLWIARTCMHLYKKLTYLVRRQHFYCMNYYLSEEMLALPERDIYTAIEVKTLLPVSGRDSMQQFFTANTWTDHWFPQHKPRLQQAADEGKIFIKKLFEKILDVNWLDAVLRKITVARWQRKQKQSKRNAHGSVMTLESGKHYAYSNAGSFRERILKLYEQKLLEISSRFIHA